MHPRPDILIVMLLEIKTSCVDSGDAEQTVTQDPVSGEIEMQVIRDWRDADAPGDDELKLPDLPGEDVGEGSSRGTEVEDGRAAEEKTEVDPDNKSNSLDV